MKDDAFIMIVMLLGIYCCITSVNATLSNAINVSLTYRLTVRSFLQAACHRTYQSLNATWSSKIFVDRRIFLSDTNRFDRESCLAIETGASYPNATASQFSPYIGPYEGLVLVYGRPINASDYCPVWGDIIGGR
jgi:hypothetical protein